LETLVKENFYQFSLSFIQENGADRKLQQNQIFVDYTQHFTILLLSIHISRIKPELISRLSVIIRNQTISHHPSIHFLIKRLFSKYSNIPAKLRLNNLQ